MLTSQSSCVFRHSTVQSQRGAPSSDSSAQAITLQVFGALTLLPVSSHVAAQHYLEARLKLLLPARSISHVQSVGQAKLAALAANMWLMRSARCLMLDHLKSPGFAGSRLPELRKTPAE